jgi:glyoxylase-like metal-dependent hydrolase (beta-lactamase superfamily II)
MVFHYADSPVEVSHPGPAHTYGDLMIYLPKYRLLFASDIAFIYVAPFAHNAHVGKWLETVDRIMKMDVDTIVPGHGPISGKKELAEMAEYFRTLQREVKRRLDAGMSPGRAAADIKLGKFDNWIGPERIVMNTVRLYNEFRGVGGPDYDLAATQKATEEYNAILASRGIKG